MFSHNPFAELSASVSPTVMQAYVVVMAVLVVGGTLFDIIHKKSARYFFDNWRDSKNKAKQQVGGGRDDVDCGADRGGRCHGLGRILQRAAAGSRICWRCTAL